MKTKRGVERDTAEDFWGEKYQIEWDNDRKAEGLRSAARALTLGTVIKMTCYRAMTFRGRVVPTRL